MKIAILFGGSSYEHEISIVSAITLKRVLGAKESAFVYIDPDRELYIIEEKNMKSTYFSSREYKKAKRVRFGKGDIYQASMLGEKGLGVDIVINLIHGRDGEDGKISSILDFNSISYIGPRTSASVVSYSKRLTKYFATGIGVEVLPFEMVGRGDERREPSFGFPVIVKPDRLGSSIGVSVANSMEELDYALDVAFEFDDEVLIEPFIEGIEEFNIAGCLTSGWELSIVEKPQKEKILDFDRKYLDFSREEAVSEAIIESSLKRELEETFQKVYDPLFTGSVTRCDFFVREGRIYLNEINPVPGSMAHYLFDDFPEMMKRLSQNLPSERDIKVNYSYIDSIRSAKGKA
jgi:D-alanine-D-alanine ligase